MKLKKVISLALAGVMAVSMLAGCGTSGKQEPTEDENGVTQTGYSAEFADIADLDLDYVTFKDSTVDQAALQKAVDSCTDVQLLAALVGGNGVLGNMVTSGGILSGAMVVPLTNWNGGMSVNIPCASVFADEADLDKYLGTSDDIEADGVNFDFAKTVDVLGNPKMGVIFAVDGTMSTDTVLSQVNKMIYSLKNALEDSATVTVSGSASAIEVDYTYTVSVSMVSRTTTMTNLATADIDFVAVTITRTGTV